MRHLLGGDALLPPRHSLLEGKADCKLGLVSSKGIPATPPTPNLEACVIGLKVIGIDLAKVLVGPKCLVIS